MKLCINQCPDCRKNWSISVDDDEGGRRVTPGKCCGRWKEKKSWPLDTEMIQEIRDQMNVAEQAIKDANE